MLPNVDVVIPVYNEEKYLGRCLAALTNIEYPKDRLNIIVADNYSEDRSVEIAYGHRVSVKRVKKYSIARTRNVGANGSCADIIAFIDSDCVVGHEWLKKAVRHFTDSEVVATGSYPTVIEDEVNLFQKTWSRLCRGNPKKSCKVDWLSTQNLILRRSAFECLGGFNENLVTCEDVDLGYRLSKIGAIVNDPNIIVYHLREPENSVEFWKKEFWHSIGNFQGVFSHGIRISEIPSLLMPVVFLIGFWISVFGIASVSPITLIAGCLLMFCPPLFYSTIKYSKGMNKKMVLWLYCVYFSARSASLFYDTLKLFKHLRIWRHVTG
ncbi:MAG: glycosyltransferase [Desulfobacter sp.]|nr:MAG: glycosyltransferase [Desulfobacter sp.]